jgi:hypothetical protein
MGSPYAPGEWVAEVGRKGVCRMVRNVLPRRLPVPTIAELSRFDPRHTESGLAERLLDEACKDIPRDDAAGIYAAVCSRFPMPTGLASAWSEYTYWVTRMIRDGCESLSLAADARRDAVECLLSELPARNRGDLLARLAYVRHLATYDCLPSCEARSLIGLLMRDVSRLVSSEHPSVAHRPNPN